MSHLEGAAEGNRANLSDRGGHDGIDSQVTKETLFACGGRAWKVS